MAGHSRPKDGVLSHPYVPAIHVLLAAHPKTWMPGTGPGMTVAGASPGYQEALRTLDDGAVRVLS
jgi:hypothetical protein